jgi:hypothetical protein
LAEKRRATSKPPRGRVAHWNNSRPFQPREPRGNVSKISVVSNRSSNEVGLAIRNRWNKYVSIRQFNGEIPAPESRKLHPNQQLVIVSGRKEGRSSTRSEAKSSEYLPLEVGLLRRYNSWNKYVSIDGLGDKDPKTKSMGRDQCEYLKGWKKTERKKGWNNHVAMKVVTRNDVACCIRGVLG